MVDQQQKIIDLLSQLVQKLSKRTDIPDPASVVEVAPKQIVVMPWAS